MNQQEKSEMQQMSRFPNFINYRQNLIEKWGDKTVTEWEAMSVGQKQELLAVSVGPLIDRIHLAGCTCRIGEVERAKPLPHGHPNSLHHRRLAIDIHLVRDGKYQQDTEDHALFGEFWESLSPIHSWGGHFGDGNHYSIRHGRMR